MTAPEPGDSELSITLMGDVAARRAGAHRRPEVPLTSAKARLALAMLTLGRRDGVRRDALADALWPEGRPPTWPSALRNAVSRTRRHLMAAMDDDPLVAQDGTYRLRLPPGVRVDVEVAESEVAVARDALEDGRPDVGLAAATEAVGRLRGTFLAGEQGPWVDAQRTRFTALLTTGLETQARAALAVGDPALAATAAEEVVGREPLRESAHRLLMSAFAVAGHRPDALRVYQRLRRVLADEMGVDPDAETEAAYLRLLGPAPAPVHAPDRDEAPAAPVPLPLVGRDDEVATALAVWARATDHRQAVLLVTGEAGIGKSRLVAEVAERVAGRGALVLLGRCDPDGLIPYQPFVEMLDALVAEAPGDDLPDLTLGARAELAGVFPSFSRWRPRPAGAPDRALLFHAVGRLVAHVARDRPLLMVLDDLDAVDGDSALLLRHLLRQVDGARVMVAAAARTELPPSHALAGTIRALERDGVLTRLHLDGLDRRSCQALVEAVLPDEPAPGALADQLGAQTSGNPFMLVEALRSRRTERTDRPAGRARWAGAGLDSLVADRMAALSDGAVALLRTAAVCGSRFELDVAVAASGLGPAEAEDATEATLASGLLVDVGHDGGSDGTSGRATPAGRLRFAHDIVRQTLYWQLGEARRRQVHERVADVVERLPAERLAGHRAALARHRSASARPDGDPRALQAALAAATEARAQGAPTEALRWCRTALGHAGPGELAGEAAVLTELGATQVQLDDDEAGATLFQAALRARQAARPDLAARAALELADLARRRPPHRADALALMGDVVDRAPAGEPDELWARVVARWVELGGASGLPVPVAAGVEAARILERRLAQHSGFDDAARRVGLAGDLLTVASVTGSVESRTAAAHHLAMARAAVGDWPAVDQALASMDGPAGDRARAERAGAEAVMAGRFDALPAHRPDPGLPDPGLVGHQRVVARWLQGALVPDDLDGLDDVDGPGSAPGLLAPARVLLDLASGRPGQARIALHGLVGTIGSSPAHDTVPHSLGLLGLAAVELGDQAMARELGRMLAPHAGLVCGIGYRTFAGTGAFHLGRMAAVTGGWAEAERFLAMALRQLTAVRALPWIALTQETLAQVLDARGRSSDRRWIGALRAEAGWSAAELGLRRAPLVPERV